MSSEAQTIDADVKAIRDTERPITIQEASAISSILDMRETLEKMDKQKIELFKTQMMATQIISSLDLPIFDPTTIPEENLKEMAVNLEQKAEQIIKEKNLKVHPFLSHSKKYRITNLTVKPMGPAFFNLFEIHCPDATEATASLEKQQGSASSSGFQITIFGAGGGAGKAKSVTFKRAINTKGGKCLKVIHDIKVDKLEFEITCSVPGCKYSSGMTEIIEPRDGYDGFKQDVIEDEANLCKQNPSTVGMEVEKYEVVEGSQNETIEVTRKNSKNLAATLEFESLKIGVTGVWETVGTLSFSYHLPGGYEYYAYTENEFPKFWKTRKLAGKS